MHELWNRNEPYSRPHQLHLQEYGWPTKGKNHEVSVGLLCIELKIFGQYTVSGADFLWKSEEISQRHNAYRWSDGITKRRDKIT